MKAKLFITDQKMLQLLKWAIETGKARNQTDYCEQIKLNPQNLPNIRRGHQSFTKEQILNACVLTGASADFVFGFSSTIKRSSSKRPMEMLREAVMAVESAMITKS